MDTNALVAMRPRHEAKQTIAHSPNNLTCSMTTAIKDLEGPTVEAQRPSSQRTPRAKPQRMVRPRGTRSLPMTTGRRDRIQLHRRRLDETRCSPTPMQCHNGFPYLATCLLTAPLSTVRRGFHKDNRNIHGCPRSGNGSRVMTINHRIAKDRPQSVRPDPDSGSVTTGASLKNIIRTGEQNTGRIRKRVILDNIGLVRSCLLIRVSLLSCRPRPRMRGCSTRNELTPDQATMDQATLDQATLDLATLNQATPDQATRSRVTPAQATPTRDTPCQCSTHKEQSRILRTT